MNKIFSVQEKLPENRQWVLAHYAGNNWGEHGKHYWVVVQFNKGKTSLELEAEKYMWITSSDEYGNNGRPYSWEQFSPGGLFGQDVDYWMPLPEPPEPQQDIASMTWNEMIKKLNEMLKNIEYDKVQKIYNLTAYHLNEPQIEHVYDPEKNEEFWIETK